MPQHPEYVYAAYLIWAGVIGLYLLRLKLRSRKLEQAQAQWQKK